MEINNTQLKKKISKYIKQIKKLLCCDHKTKAKYINDMQINIEDYLSINQNAKYDDIVEHFGTPDTIAKEFATQLGIDYIKKSRTKNILKIAVIVFLLALTISIVGIATVIIKTVDVT